MTLSQFYQLLGRRGDLAGGGSVALAGAWSVYAKARVTEAERAGVKSVPALVIGGQAIHLNFGADLAVLK